MSSDSMWSDYEIDYLIASEENIEKREKWEAKQRKLRKEVPDWLHDRLSELSASQGKSVSYWKKHGRFRAYIGKEWTDIRSAVEEALS